MPSLRCPVCGVEFTRGPSQMRQGPMYCSRECQKQAALVTKVCVACGKAFTVRKTQAERSGAKYCSAGCSNRGRRALGQGRGELPVERTCLRCGKTFMAYVSEVKRGGGYFCSPLCADKAYQRGMGGNRSGVGVYYGPSWRSSRAAAVERDNHRCVDCGRTAEESGDHLQVHHLERFGLYGLARHEEANRLENLVTLCISCHARRHPTHLAAIEFCE